jgi:hypothetical protein
MVTGHRRGIKAGMRILEVLGLLAFIILFLA